MWVEVQQRKTRLKKYRKNSDGKLNAVSGHMVVHRGGALLEQSPSSSMCHRRNQPRIGLPRLGGSMSPQQIYAQTGVTLIEIVAGLAIIALLAGLAIPNLISQLPKYRLNGATRQVMSDLMAARMLAVSQKHDVQVAFTNPQEYTIWVDVNDNNIKDSGEEKIKNIQKKYYDVTFTSNNNPKFLPRGTVTNLPTIVLTNTSGSKNVTVSIAGRVRTN